MLAERLESERAATRRALADLVDVLPPNVDRFNFLFHTAVQGSALDANDPLGRQLEERLSETRFGANALGDKAVELKQMTDNFAGELAGGMGGGGGFGAANEDGLEPRGGSGRGTCGGRCRQPGPCPAS